MANIYGADNIKRHLQRQKLERKESTSIADKPHGNNRAAERLRRQQERDAKK